MGEDEELERLKEYIEDEVEEEEVSKPRRGRPPKKYKIEIPKDVEETLKKIDGATTLKLMQFLHTSYLSWINEAEATKYYNVSRQAWTEAMQMQEKTIRELVQAFTQQIENTLAPSLDSVNRALETIESRVKQLEASAAKPIIDDRLILLGATLVKAFKDKLGLSKEISDLLDAIIVSAARDILLKSRLEMQQQQSQAQEGRKE